MPDAIPPTSSATAAFVQALTAAQAALRAYCEASLGLSEEAKDAWQKTNVVLWQKRDEWDPNSRFLSWALSVARYEVLGVIRDRQRERLVFDDDVAQMMADASLPHAESYDFRRDALYQCLGRLPHGQRDLLTLHYVFGHKQAAIAEAHGMGLSAVKVLLLRIRRTLAKCIEHRLQQQAV